MWTNARDISSGKSAVYGNQLHTKNECEGDLKISTSRFSNLRELTDVLSLTKMERAGKISLNYLLVPLGLGFS